MNTRLSSIIVAVALAWAWTGSSAKAAETYSGLLRGSEVRGAKVKNLQNEEIGDIQEIVIEPVAGLLRFAVVSVPSPGCDAAGPSGGGRKQHVGWRGLLDSTTTSMGHRFRVDNQTLMPAPALLGLA
jgi:hypothetical protein